MAIARFSVSTNTIPLWIPHIDTSKESNPAGDPDQTIYRVGVSIGGNPIQFVPLVWTPQVVDSTQPKNVSPDSPQEWSPYYYMFNV